MSTSPTSSTHADSVSLLALHRGQLVAVAIIGIILGLVGLFFPGAALLTVAIVFGIYLVASGIFRINAALLARNISTGLRWFTGFLGVLIVAAGVICLSDPFGTLIVLAFVIGVGWVAEGVTDIMSAVQGSIHPRWFGWLSGVLSVLAGITMFVLPALGLTTFIEIGAILLLVVSVSTLLTIPRRAKA